MDNQAHSNQNSTMAFSWRRSIARGIGLSPGHYFQIKDVQVIVKLATIPPSKYKHLSATN